MTSTTRALTKHNIHPLGEVLNFSPHVALMTAARCDSGNRQYVRVVK